MSFNHYNTIIIIEKSANMDRYSYETFNGYSRIFINYAARDFIPRLSNCLYSHFVAFFRLGSRERVPIPERNVEARLPAWIKPSTVSEGRHF